MSSDKLVVARRYTYAAEADLARIHLVEAGIPAVVNGTNIVVADWLLGNAAGYIRLEVAESDLQAAIEILSQASPAATLGEKNPEECDQEICLQCGEEFPQTETRCAHCGWTFEDLTVRRGGESSGHRAERPPVLRSFRWIAKWGIRIIVAGIALISAIQLATFLFLKLAKV